MARDLKGLEQRQRGLVEQWLPGAVVEDDLSWGLIGTTVLQLRVPDGATYVLKAGDRTDHHIARELAAHRRWLGPLVTVGRAPELVHADAEAKVLVTRYLPGLLVDGSDAEWDAGTYRQAGELLARFHGQYAEHDDGAFERRQRDATLTWLDRPHRIAPEFAALLTDEVQHWPTPRTVLVPTHGDWQPRNWLVHNEQVSVIDFGRAELRPRHSDLGRLATQQFLGRPDLEAAFFEAYGPDPREPGAWFRSRVRDAVSTAAWALGVGDESFERQGLRMVADAVAELGRRGSVRRGGV